MKAGRELDYRKIDALVAEHIMEFEFYISGDDVRIKLDGTGAFVCFSPSRNISAAWKVVGKFEDEGYQVCIELLAKKIYSVGIYYPPHADQVAYIKAKTVPLAICIASLRLKGIDIDE